MNDWYVLGRRVRSFVDPRKVTIGSAVSFHYKDSVLMGVVKDVTTRGVNVKSPASHRTMFVKWVNVAELLEIFMREL